MFSSQDLFYFKDGIGREWRSLSNQYSTESQGKYKLDKYEEKKETMRNGFCKWMATEIMEGMQQKRKT